MSKKEVMDFPSSRQQLSTETLEQKIRLKKLWSNEQYKHFIIIIIIILLEKITWKALCSSFAIRVKSSPYLCDSCIKLK